MVNLCLLTLSLSLCLGMQNIGTYDLMLDPGRINTWKTKWASTQLELSKSNQDASGVAATFFINLSSSLVAGVIEVTFPTGFDLSGVTEMAGAVVTGQTVQVPATIANNVDSTLVIRGVTNPAVSGAYGPFALRTRNSPSGQLVDVNLNFGHAYITPTEGKLTVEAVSYVSGSNNIINKSNTGLRFKFTINKTLWAHDLVRITIASQFTLANPACSSVDVTGKINNFNSTNSADPHSIHCVVSAKESGTQLLWIYGLANDLDVLTSADNRYISLQVTGFTNPDRDYPDTSYVWKVETLRFNTKNVLEAGTATGPSTAPDTILIYTWKPTWGRPVSTISPDQIMYMDVSFTTVNPIPDGSFATISTNVDTVSWGSSYRCYVVTYLASSITCSQQGGITTVTGLGKLPAGTAITVRTLTKFKMDDATTRVAKIVSLFTRSAETWPIDTARDVASFTLPTASPFTLNVLLQQADQTAAQKAGGTGNDAQYIKFQLQGIAGLLAAGTTKITITCPLAGTADDWQFGIPLTSSNLQKKLKTSSPTADFSTGTTYDFKDAKTPSLALGTDAVLTAGSVGVDPKSKSSAYVYSAGSVSFTLGSNYQSSSELAIAIFVTGLTGLSQVVSSGAIILPRIVTNPSTAYECAVSLIDTATASASVTVKAPAYAVGQFQIDMQDFDSAQNGFTYFCKRGTLGGAPLKITFRPFVVDIYQSTASQTYYLEIELPTDTYYTYSPGSSTFHLSGLTEGEAYPMDSNLSTGPSMIVTAVGGNNSFFHRVTGLGNVSPVSTPVEIYFPVGVARGANPILKLRSYFVRSADPRFKHYTHLTTMDTKASNLYTIDTTSASDGDSFDRSSIYTGNNQIDGNSMGTNPLTFEMKLSTAITGDVYFYIVLPRGYSFSTLKNVQSNVPAAGSTFGFTKYFSSTNLRFAFPGVLVKATTSGARVDNTLTLISLIGVNVPLGSQSSDVVFVHGMTQSMPKEKCAFSFTGTLTSITGAITSISVSPNVIQGRGPNGVDIAHTIIFTLPHGIDYGGNILVSLSSEWSSTTASTCTAKGLTDVSTTSVVTCTFTGNDFLITNFADFSTTTFTSVTVDLQHLLPPAVDYRDNSKTLQLVKAITSFGSSSIGGTAIDNYTPGANSLVTVLPSLQPGLTTYVSINIQPPNAGTLDNDLDLLLTFPYDLPAWTTVSVSVPYPALFPSSDIKDRCYLSPLRYRSCSLVAGAFIFVLSEKYTARTVLELFVDHAVNAPTEVKPPVASMHYVFRTLVSWFGAAVVDDGVGSFRGSQEISPQQKLTSSFSTGLTPLTFTPRNALETAVYTLSFQNSVLIAVDDAIYVIWPDEFDPYVGSAEKSYASDPGSFYLPCSSPQMGAINCRVDHWVMVIRGSTAVPVSTDVSISISNVKNPGPNPTGNFKLMHVDKKGTLLEYNSAFGNVNPTPLARNVEVRSIEVSSRSLSTEADYTFHIYASDTISRSTELHIIFPSEYDLKLVNQKSSYSCHTFRVSEAPSSQRLQETWNPSIACLSNSNTVSLPPPTSQELLSSTDLVSVTLSGVRNPEWGQVRSPNSATWDFDVVDSSIWPIWSWWTSQFKINVFQGSSSQSYSSRSYSMLNAAYLGFLQSKRTLSINNYNPQDRSNRIIVYPGTQSTDIKITTANTTVPLAATHLTFTAKTNTRTPDGGMLTYSSFKDDWVMLQDEHSTRFRVAADKRTYQGLYYISWTLEEGKLGASEQYSVPPITLIEVPAYKSAVYSFVVDQISAIAVGATSMPIRLSISNPPHSDVSVNINLLHMPETVTVTPRTLVFRPDMDSLFFYINVRADHDSSQTSFALVSFTLSGTNADVYQIQSSYEVPIETRYVEVAGSVANIEILNLTRTSFTMKPSVDEPGVLYYHVSSKGSKILTFDEIRSSLPSFIYTWADHNGNQTYNAAVRQAAASSSDPPEGVSWNDFRHAAFVAHMKSFSKLGGTVILQKNVAETIQITGLWAGATYQIVAYLDNLNPVLRESSRTLQTVTTLPIASNQQVALTFPGLVPQDAATTIGQILAKHYGVNTQRVPLTSYILVNQTSRRMQSTSVPASNATSVVTATVCGFTLLTSRSSDYPTPTDLAALQPSDRADLYSDIFSALKLTPTNYDSAVVTTSSKPIWQVAPVVNETTADKVTLQFQASGASNVCCVALDTISNRLLPDQVWEGYSSDWSPAKHGCSAVLTTGLNNVTVRYLDPDTTYYVHCVASDNTLLWPVLMSYSETVPVPFISVHTPQYTVVETNLSSAVLLQLAVWVLLN